jgi:hypothetical protein
MENIERICHVNYIPTFEDILQSTNEETQINEIPTSEKNCFSLLDIHKKQDLYQIQQTLYLYTKHETKIRFLIYSIDSMNFLNEQDTEKAFHHFKVLSKFINLDILMVFSNVENFLPKFEEMKKEKKIKSKNIKSFFQEKKKIYKKMINSKLKLVFISVTNFKDEKLKMGVSDYLNGLVIESLVKNSSFYDF